jgi:hypothetical protein
MDNPHIEINPEIPGNAVSIYSQSDAMDDFPVLKAFQQYIDAEHAKARKRLISLGIFFGIFTGVIISIFVVLLMNVSARNQALNDRLIDFAMKDRDRQQAAVVVQPPIQQDNSALVAMTAKLDALQKQLNDNAAGKKAEEAAKVKAEAAKPKGPTEAELEVVRLKALLSAEKEKLAEEKKRQKELELEAYRRKHYPELYGEKKAESETKTVKVKKAVRTERRQKSIDELTDEDISDEALGLGKNEEDESLDDSDAISYFDDADEEADESKPRKKTKKTNSPSRGYYLIPVEVRGKSSNWQVPGE